MSTPFYDLASLVVVPSGYKAAKIYAQKPLTTDGQLAFTRASTATRVNASGLIEAVASGLPRLDYLGSTCPRLLLEPQRTNAQTYSEDFSQAKYTKTQCTITANVTATLDPAGFNGSDKLVENVSVVEQHYIFFTAQTGVNQETQISIFAKAGGRTQFLLWESAITNAQAIYNLSTGTISGISSGNAANLVTTTPTITEYENGWYRCTLNYKTASGGGTIRVQLYNGSTSYNGNGTDGIFLYGLQEEVNASYATSYIPTLGTSVTRVADAASKTGISSLIGQTEGTMFGELKLTAYDTNGFIPILLNNTAGNAEVYVWFLPSGAVRGSIWNGGVQQAEINSASGLTTIGGTYKFALAYKQNDFVFYVNGQQIGTDTNGTVGAMSVFQITYNALDGYSYPLNIKQALIFKTRLTNAQLAELTA